MANYTYTATGGGGAGYHAIINITEGGYYTVVVGGGGLAVGSGKGGSPTGGNGEATTITSPSNVTLVSAGGGTGGRSGPNWATRGSGGTLSKNGVQELTVYTSTNGNNGGAYAGGDNPAVGGAAGPISGHTWGGSGRAQGNYAGGRADASYHGYFMIKYLGPIPERYTFTIDPTPADATVVLSASGETQQGNSITVYRGATVSWTVSKSQYVTQTGTTTVTEDTTESVSLVQADPLFYCYSANNYYYYFTPYPTPGQREMYFKTNFTRAYSASEIGNHLTITVSSVTSSTLTYGSITINRFAEGDLYS